MRALSGARTDARLYRLRINIGTRTSARNRSHCWTRLWWPVIAELMMWRKLQNLHHTGLRAFACLLEIMLLLVDKENMRLREIIWKWVKGSGNGVDAGRRLITIANFFSIGELGNHVMKSLDWCLSAPTWTSYTLYALLLLHSIGITRGP